MIRSVVAEWIAECDALARQARREAEGAPPVDLSSYSEWREQADETIMSVLAFYGAFLSDQADPVSGALHLPDVACALEIAGVYPPDRPTATRLLMVVHSERLAVEAVRRAVKA